MKEKNHSKNGWEQVCAGLGPEDGIPPAILARRALNRSKKKSEHRSRQYCKQIQHAIEGGLHCDCGNARLRDLTVADVEPISSCAAVLVTVVTRDTDLDQIDCIQQSLTESAGILRAAIASGTHRKRVPTLRFRVLPDMQS